MFHSSTALLFSWFALAADAPPIDATVEFQPLAAQVRRVVEAMEFLGEPLPADDLAAIRATSQASPSADAIRQLQTVLDKHVLMVVSVNPESRVKSQAGPAPKSLNQTGWRNFFVKVINEAGVTAKLRVSSPNALPLVKPGSGSPEPKMNVTLKDVPDRFMDVTMFDKQPLEPTLSGLRVEYRILQIYCRDAGKREALFTFDVGQGTQDIGFRGETSILFESTPAIEVVLAVKDHDGSPTMASFTFRDRQGRVLPAPARRLAPDFFFHSQVYRQDNESVRLPPGTYTVEYTRGPEYLVDSRTITVPPGGTHREEFKLRRWIEPKKLGWYSGDHHIHGAGCQHYDNPTQGVTPADMFRHCLGEDLNVGCVLSWGPCWYFQKQYFEGKVHQLSQANYLMRYDVEVSGFPSSHCGHLCLLNLKEDDYPNTTRIEQWPSWDLPVLQWGKKQGGVVGFSHSAAGLVVKTTDLPNYVIPPFDGIGANEYIVDVVHDACDFISTVDTQAPAELNIWYHTLNCGYRCRISGETDFPCIYGQRVGVGRVYVQHDGPLDFEKWVMNLKAGRSYVGDGLSHLIDMKVDDVALGVGNSQKDLAAPGKVTVTVQAAALLQENPVESIRHAGLMGKPYWHVEKARVGNTNTVPVEVVVNGHAVAKQLMVADGQTRELKFEVPIQHSSWLALRIYPSSHTNPVFIQVDGKPIRASKRSAQWCIDSVAQCWKQKSGWIRAPEKEAAKKAFDQATEAYTKALKEAVAE